MNPRLGGRLELSSNYCLSLAVPQLAYLRACSGENTQREEITDVVANTKAESGIKGVSTKKGGRDEDLSSMLDSLMVRMKSRGCAKIEKTTEQ